MAIDFPNTPTSGDSYTVGDKSWQWDGAKWIADGAFISPSILKVDQANSRVGIGTTTPTQTLDVNGIASASTFVVKSGTGTYAAGALGYTDSNWGLLYRPPQAGATAAHLFESFAGADLVAIKEDGKVGIGTTAPTYPLHVQSDTQPQLFIQAATNADAVIRSGSGPSWVNNFHQIRFNHYAVASGHGPDNKINFEVNGGTEATPTTRMTINGDGKVGIGTTTPVTPLHIESDDGLTTFTGTGRGAMSIANTAYTSGDLQAIDFMYLTGSNPCVRIAAEMTGGGSLLHFGTSNAYATGITNQAMTIDATGLVGIGTTAPDEPLHVVHTTDIARIKVEGASSGYTQSDILLESVGSSRGAGIYTFNSGNDKTWFFGSPYSSTDEFIVARVDNAAFQESTASTGNAYLRVGWRITGNAYFASTLVYDRYTTTAENVNVNSSGLIRRSTSSARYKTDIETLWDDEADKVLQLRPAWFRSTSSEDRSDWSHEGFIAEEVDKVNQRWCTYGPAFITDDDGAFITDDDGVRLTETDANGEEILQPEAVQYTRIIPALVNVVQRQQTQIDTLSARIETLETV